MRMNVSVHMSVHLNYLTFLRLRVTFWILKIDNLLEAFRYRNASSVMYSLEAVENYSVKQLLIFR